MSLPLPGIGSLVIPGADLCEFWRSQKLLKTTCFFFTDIWIHLIYMYAMGQQKVNGEVYLDLREAPCVEFSANLHTVSGPYWP